MEDITMSSRPPPSATSAARPPDFNPSFSPQRSTSPTAAQQHRRGYQACDPCRKRKVKCDLGSVDNPRPPPCVRCRRESKRCEFSATRRKRKISEDADENRSGDNDVLRRDKRMMSADTSSMAVDPSATATVAVDNGNKRTNDVSHPPAFKSESGNSAPHHHHHHHHRWAGTSSSSPASQSYAAHTTLPSEQYHRRSQRPSFSGNGRPAHGPHALESGQHMMNKTAADLLSPAISNTHDALHLLSEAAGRTEDLNRQQMESKYGAAARNPSSSSSAFNTSVSPLAHGGTAPSNAAPSNTGTQQHGASMGWYNQGKTGTHTVDSTTAAPDSSAQPPKSPEQVDYENARRVWSRLRFIRAGWFSVDEAMAYIAYYYEHLAPLGPIVLPDFASPSTHLTLLTQEPVLTVTMLTIASRHMKLTGNGANSRAYSIHEKLWSYLRGMIERLFWGQEKFGSGSLPTGFSKPRQFTPMSTGQAADFNGDLRSLGTVEALLLLTDWHPRALHFPPGDDENTLLDMDAQLLAQINDNNNSKEEDKTQNGNPEGRLAFYKWLEPVWRSDRMSWMLLSTAQALAFELGLFDHKNDLKNSSESPSEQTRKRRVRRLILVYVSQSSGRLGIPSMLPLPQWHQTKEPNEPDDVVSSEDNSVELMQDCWMAISKIMYITNHELFLNKEHTSNLIKSGQYRDRIDESVPWLDEFKRKLDGLANTMTPQMRFILTIEYEYTRLYVNCLALQAVVDRWTTITNEANLGPNQAGGPTAPLRVLLEQYEVNEPYIQEVVDASRRILHIVLDDLIPGGYLKHAPVRTFFRILSGMIFILKTFTLGAKEDDVRISLELQDRTIDALRNCVVDDVHLSVTIADLLQLLTTNIRTRFLRFAPFDRADQCPSPDRVPAVPSSPQTGDQDNGGNYRWQGQQQPQGLPPTSNFPFVTPVTTQNDPLANIPAHPINATNLNVSFMPPPPSVYYNYYDPAASTSPKMDTPQLDNSTSTVTPQNINTTNAESTAANGTSNGNPSNATMSDWFALPLDQFFNSSTAGVDQGLGGTGPMVGEFDMLEVLLKEQYTGDPTGPNSGTGMSGQFL